ncbi:nitroreductase family protein [Mycobacterium sp. HUMS_1102779]
MMSLGCVLQNMWLMANSSGLGFQALSASSVPAVEQEVKTLLAVPDRMKVVYAVRPGHPVAAVPYLRVRREVAEFAHRNGFGRGLIG